MKRIYHTWDKWECCPAGFYEKHHPTMDDEACREAYREFLQNIPLFTACMHGVLADWPRSTEHYLSNENMNRIAWLGQSAMCYATKVPSAFCGGYNRLTPEEKHAADTAALRVLNEWLASRGEPELPDLKSAASKTEANLY